MFKAKNRFFECVVLGFCLSFFLTPECYAQGASLRSTQKSEMKRGLSPPWWIFQKKLKAALEADSCIKVSDLEGRGYVEGRPRYGIQIIELCRDTSKSQAVSTLFSGTFQFPIFVVDLSVIDDGGTVNPEPYPSTSTQLEQLIQNSFQGKGEEKGNKYFSKIIDGNAFNAFFVLFKASVIQISVDDLKEAYGLETFVAAEVFEELLALKGSSGTVRFRESTDRISE